jgi:hypothetical protein
MHCSILSVRIVGMDYGACTHVLQAHDGPEVVASDALETYACALGTGESCCTSRLTRLFFMLEVHSLQGTAGHVAARSPPRGETGPELQDTWRFGALPAGPVAARQVPEPTYAERRVLEPLNTWQSQSTSWLGGWIQRGGAWLRAPLFYLDLKFILRVLDL